MSKKYLVSYDLLTPGKDYSKLYSGLAQLGAKRAMLSTWALRSTLTSRQIYDFLRSLMDENDRLLVNELTTDWVHSSNLLVDLNTI